MRGRAIVFPLLALLLIPAIAGAAHAEAQSTEPIAAGTLDVGVLGGYILAYAAERFSYQILQALLGEEADPLPIPDETPYSFPVRVDHRTGDWLETQVVDRGGQGYFVDMMFKDADGWEVPASCLVAPGSHALAEEPFGELAIHRICETPVGATTLIVHAHHGLDLHVSVVLAAPPTA